MVENGARIILETARFWASRVSYSKKDNKYHINGVIGPDEFHINVDDNAYTNYMAKWNLGYAVDIYNELKNEEDVKILLKKIELKEKEVKKWADIAGKIVILRSEKNGLIEQFNGYFKKKDIKITEHDYNFLPVSPGYFEYSGMNKTSIIKQADVLALFCLFPEEFSFEEKQANYKYYIQRTSHQSSLSYCMHSILASDLGDFFRSFIYFWMAVNTDLLNVAGNTIDGIHAANLGGIWQSLIFGFGGVKCTEDTVRIAPKLPGNFKKMNFKFFHKTDLFEVEETHGYIKLRFIPKKSSAAESREVWVFGKNVKLIPFKYKTVKLEKFWINVITAMDLVKEKNLVTINENTYVREIGGIFDKEKVTSAPVIDNGNNIVGVISDKNILQSTFKNRFGNLRAMDIMEIKVVAVSYRDSLEQVVKTFTKYPYRRLPVLKSGKVVGVIARSDIITEFLSGKH